VNRQAQPPSKTPPINKTTNNSQSTANEVTRPKLRNLDSELSSFLQPSSTQEENSNISKEALKLQLDNARLKVDAAKIKVETLELQYQMKQAK